MKRFIDTGDGTMDAALLVTLAFLAVGLVIVLGVIAIPVVIVVALFKAAHWYATRPTPTADMYQAAVAQTANIALPAPDDFALAFLQAFVRKYGRHRKPCLPVCAKIEQTAHYLYFGENFHATAPPMPPICNNPIDEGRYRDQLILHTRKLGDAQRSLALFNGAITAAFDAVVSRLPAFACLDPSTIDDEPDDATTVPLIGVLTDLPQIVNDIVHAFYSDAIVDQGLFTDLRAQFDANLEAVSDAVGKKKVILPLDFSGTAHELVRGYLGGTFFDELLDVRVPFQIPQHIRFQHQWIVARPGAGKSTLLQHLINQDLAQVAADKASIVVMDSNRELVKAVAGLKQFAPGQPLHGKLVFVDLEDVEFPIALNLFDLGADASAAHTAADREALRNSVLSLYDYFFAALLSADLTSRQNTLFNFTIQLLFEIPNSNLDTLIALMQPQGIAAYAAYIDKLDPDAKQFFQLKFNNPDYNPTKSQVVDRLFAVKRIRTLSRMFSAKKSRLDFYKEMASAKVIVINAPLSLLQEDGVEIVSRFFLAMILLAAQKRLLQPREQRKPCYVYIDECHDIIKRDTKITSFLDQARRLAIPIILAHQRLNQLQPHVLDALYGSTAIKFASQISDAASHALARDMRCTPEFILNQPQFHFAAFVRGMTDRAVSIGVPFVDMYKMPRMTDAELAAIRDGIRRQYAIRYPDGGTAEPEPNSGSLTPPANPPPRPQPDPPSGPKKSTSGPAKAKPDTPDKPTDGRAKWQK